MAAATGDKEMKKFMIRHAGETSVVTRYGNSYDQVANTYARQFGFNINKILTAGFNRIVVQTSTITFYVEKVL